MRMKQFKFAEAVFIACNDAPPQDLRYCGLLRVP